MPATGWLGAQLSELTAGCGGVGGGNGGDGGQGADGVTNNAGNGGAAGPWCGRRTGHPVTVGPGGCIDELFARRGRGS
ncbi:hypothetical protein [Mycobacterium sp.]|uniref:hypothetical protein n=1 Tax=Mycobacterium sp. TaxID=1785 RepID=UPI003F94DA8B